MWPGVFEVSRRLDLIDIHGRIVPDADELTKIQAFIQHR